MSRRPWLTIVGLGEDGPGGLPPASLAALKEAEYIIGPPRHLGLLPSVAAELIEWPVPFSDGLDRLEALRGQRTVALASGDPFWFGAGTMIAHRFDADEWRALPGPSIFSLAATRLGWPLETTHCAGLHAAPLSRLRPALAPGARIITTLRNGEDVPAIGRYLADAGFGASTVTILQAIGGPRERTGTFRADALDMADFAHPVCCAIQVAGDGMPLPLAPGLPDKVFETDGQITKRPVRALTLSALAPRHGETLWDIGGGSGSIAIEWLLCHRSLQAMSIETRPDRAARIRTNADRLGVDRLHVVEGRAPQDLADLPDPHAVFIGGGLSESVLRYLHARLAPGTRLVANAVTLESETLVIAWQSRLGGDLLRIDLAQAHPLGSKTGWKQAYPLVQWSVTL